MTLLFRPNRAEGISIHALRGEGDAGGETRPHVYLYFNPRPPWGGRRPQVFYFVVAQNDFNPRPPWGGRPDLL